MATFCSQIVRRALRLNKLTQPIQSQRFHSGVESFRTENELWQIVTGKMTHLGVEAPWCPSGKQKRGRKHFRHVNLDLSQVGHFESVQPWEACAMQTRGERSRHNARSWRFSVVPLHHASCTLVHMWKLTENKTSTHKVFRRSGSIVGPRTTTSYIFRAGTMEYAIIHFIKNPERNK